MFVNDFGSSPVELFSSFNPNPIAAASLAEVFKATTHQGQGIISHIFVEFNLYIISMIYHIININFSMTSQEVAVKVQYHDLRERFESDVATCATILDLIEV